MILNSYIEQELFAARRRDLQEAAERTRLAAQARAHRDRAFRFSALRAVLRRRLAAEPCPPITCAPGGTR